MSDASSANALAHFISPQECYEYLYDEVARMQDNQVEWQCRICRMNVVDHSKDGVARKFKEHLELNHPIPRTAPMQPALEVDCLRPHPGQPSHTRRATVGLHKAEGSEKRRRKSEKSEEEQKYPWTSHEATERSSRACDLRLQSDGIGEPGGVVVDVAMESRAVSSTSRMPPIDDRSTISLHPDSGATLPNPSTHQSSSFTLGSAGEDRFQNYEDRVLTFREYSEVTRKMARAGFYLVTIDGSEHIRCWVCSEELVDPGDDLENINTKVYHHDGCPMVGSRLDDNPEDGRVQVSASNLYSV